MKRRRNPQPAPLKGQKWRQTHQATVDAILGAGVRTVVSRGSQFYNKDNWTARTFAGAVCAWAKLNPGATPTYSDIQGFVTYANRTMVYDSEKGIVIASTPDDLPRHLALALVGGGYHEAWHTEWSRIRPLSMGEVWPRILDLWNLIPYEEEGFKKGWAGLTGPLLEWSNIIEDIRIERCGCRKYPGSQDKMEALQDLILKQEEEGRAAAEHRKLPINDDLAVVMGTFRDLGLGYETPQQKVSLMNYRQRSPAGYLFVTVGPLRDILDRAIALGPNDDLESLWLAMEVVATIAKVAKAQPQMVPAPPDAKPDPNAPKMPAPPQPVEDNDEDDEDEQDQDESQEESEDDAQGQGDGEESNEDDSEESDAPPPSSAGAQSSSNSNPQPELWKVGDRAVLKAGPYAGREVEVVRAGLPDENGRQELSYALVEQD